MSSFAENLRTAMAERSLTQAELSKRTGISKSFISQYLSGKFKPREDKLSILAQALGTTKGALLGYESTGSSSNDNDIHKVPVFSADDPSNQWGEEYANTEHGSYRFYICRDDKNRPFVMFGDYLLVSIDEISTAGLYAVVKEGTPDRVYFREFSDPRKDSAELGLRIIGRVCEIRRKMT
ncbi:helix-turn-helix domain-containing protein [Ruminococcus albus]|uniref:Helix-turn-helix domain protein n=1 Tax=Ruminococcus albus (strain ATCC 27210 / DSM 20455 / JCM 14654 / NCDO 2250 / 7) TaxID=697329 RepID=E6UEQ2_RUMA7|nr:helix-turn-helix domain-containing protein [Ruminococcus albus]ADU21821.1 helix-turn-helix domain protein [Ruminococcus albus 7 = DSM 20455]